ncbi:YciI family protein [Pleionea litopenaei]|uniref:YciI family protein n=1 Tax=Pleionea litopenaei TaxID=3070815 RepID=A0AA51RUM2_9GAMM|nr:YciI family protein [Pleionea sp. HL-JVS1]WMS87931.1 YciI family protein [Pleionea sp. HL-JVS1]
MQFLCLIYEDESIVDGNTDEQNQALFADYMKFTESVKASGNLVAGDALQPTSTATTVRVRNGQKELYDGPFAETKEQLGGYYLLECQSLDEAIELASRIPSAQYGSIEVRPIMMFE